MKNGSTHSILIGAFFVVVFGALFFFFSQMGDYAQPTGAQVFEPPVLSPSVVTLLSISPNNVSQASTLEYSLTGVEFDSSAVVSTSNPDVAVLSTVVVNDTLILVNMTVAINATTGFYDVVVTQGVDSSILPSSLEIYEGPFDPATLVNLSAGYFAFNYSTNSTEPVTLIYNITTAPGVDKSIVEIEGGYAEVTDVNTSNVTIINLSSAVDPEGTFTLTFDPTIFYEEGDYEVELYLDLEVDEEYVDREYYGPYFGVGILGCIPAGCNIVGQATVPVSVNVPVLFAITPMTSCVAVGAPAGCSAAVGVGAQCVVSCTVASAGAGVFQLLSSDSSGACAPAVCSYSFSPAPTPTPTVPPPSGGGGSGGGTNSYTGSVICPSYCKQAKYSNVAICASAACQAAASIKAGPPPGVTYSGPSEEEKVPPVHSPPKNEPINIQMPPESRVPLDRRTVPEEQLPVEVKPFKLPPGFKRQFEEERRPPTVPIEQLEKYRTLQPKSGNPVVNFVVEIKDLFVNAPVRVPELEFPMVFAKREEMEEWQSDIMILKRRAMSVNPAAQVIAANNPDIAVGPDDILSVK